MAKRKQPNALVPAKNAKDKDIAPIDEKLTDKERLFIEQYFICNLNGTEAAMQVFDCKSRSVASVIASEYLAKPKIHARVQERLEKYHLTANEVLARMAADARGTMEDFVDPDSGTIDLKKAAGAKSLGLIKRYRNRITRTTRQIGENASEEVETLEIEIELYDGQAARRDLAKHLGLLTERNLNVNVDLSAMSDEQLDDMRKGKLPQGVEIVRKT